MLTECDAKRFGLDTSNVNYRDEKTRDNVWRILDEVKEKIGFSHAGNKLLIQFYPSRDGGAELFVTKLENLPEKSEKLISKADDMAMLEKSSAIYRFGDYSDLVRSCCIIKEKNGIGKSELYFSESEGFYLLLEERGMIKNGGICEFAVMLEFSDKIRTERLPYIREHCSLLIERNAIEELASV
jgi:negative regulator of genetic competence, sporulation and motility